MSALSEVFARFGVQFDSRQLEAGESKVNRTTAALKRLGAAVASGLLLNSMRGFIDESVQLGDELDKTSKSIGISTSALQAWRLAADLSGVGMDQFNGSLVRLQRSMLDTKRGLKTSADTFTRLGVSVTDAEGQLRPVEDVLLDLADPLSQLESSTERTALLTTIFGRVGARMGPLFLEGRDGVQALLNEFDRLGGGASEDFIQAAAALQDANTRLSTSLLGLRSRIAVLLMPALQRMTDAVTGAVAAFTRFAGKSKIVEAALLTIKAIMIAVGVAGALAFAPLILTIGILAAGFAAIVLIVEDVMTAMEGGDAVTSQFVKSLKDFFELQTGPGSYLQSLVDGWNGLLDTLRSVANAILDILGLPVPDVVAETLGLRSASTRERLQQTAAGRAALRGEYTQALQNLGSLVASSGGSPIPIGLSDGASTAQETLAYTSNRGLTTPPPSISQSTRNEIQIDVSGMGAREAARQIAREVSSQIDRQAQTAIEDLGGGGA